MLTCKIVRLPLLFFFQLETGYLQHVFNVFERLGYETGDNSSDWSVLWSHVHPFTVLSRHTTNLKPHQKVCPCHCRFACALITYTCVLKLSWFLLNCNFLPVWRHSISSVNLCAGQPLPRVRSSDKQSITGQTGYSTHSRGVSDSIGVTRFTVIRELTVFNRYFTLTVN